MTLTSPCRIIAVAVLALAAAPRVSEAAVITVVADPADANTQDHYADGNLDGTADEPQKDNSSPALWIGRQPNGPGNDQVRAAVFPYQLPAAPADSTLIGATLNWNLIQADSPSWAVDLYGLTRTSSSPGSLAADHFVGGSDPSNTLIQTGFLAAGAGSGPVATSVPQLKQFVQQKYDDGATGEFVFFRLNPNQESTSLSNARFTVNSADAGTVPSRPELLLSFAPEGTDVFTLVDGFDGYDGTDDAWIDRDDSGNRNHGGEDAIRVYNRSGRDSLGLLRFDLSPLAQEASKVTSAKLVLTTKYRENDSTADGELIDLHMIAPADSDWVEGDGTGQVPGDSGTLGGSSTFNEKQHGVEDWSVTSRDDDYGFVGVDRLLATATMASTPGGQTVFEFSGDLQFLLDWAKDPSSNAGFLLSSPNANDFLINNEFYSSEAAVQAFRPQLVITAVVPEPGAAALAVLAAAGLLAGWRRRRA